MLISKNAKFIKDNKVIAYKVTVKGLKVGTGTVKVNVLVAKVEIPVLATALQKNQRN